MTKETNFWHDLPSPRTWTPIEICEVRKFLSPTLYLVLCAFSIGQHNSNESSPVVWDETRKMWEKKYDL